MVDPFHDDRFALRAYRRLVFVHDTLYVVEIKGIPLSVHRNRCDIFLTQSIYNN